jgi:DNA-binding GntR family transcriptional regulator
MDCSTARILVAFLLLFHPMVRTKLHEQVRRGIEKLLIDRALKPGSQLPTESELASELYVSRTTIRNALKVLEQEGKIERTPGDGRLSGSLAYDSR